MEPRFLSSVNLFNVMRQVSITGLLAIGMTFVILTAGIDLSIGSLLAFAGLVAAAVAKGGMQDRFTVGDETIGYGWQPLHWPQSRSASSAAGCRASPSRS
jgi:inositol transport system permease protein